jgi:alpha-tubulin suppressor-like RCC1 family protein
LETKIFNDFGSPEYDFVDDWKCLYKNYGSVYVFGLNGSGQLGLGDTVERATPTKVPHFNVRMISAGHYHTAAIDFNDDVWINLKILS